ncbi:putative sugar transporter NDAI_0I01390 [Naumovozyma dairenensis CBS 421]|uniref:Major facilitator superfamily (MFS) profile domain-containing protein n=1 Tax=Naumovozyma dairenensis (strain ATCC 10597 / BCRC 20456 / CBS 421 / NBRC 0211 / NRRL Y-12639) TaxID=1071378 RepID=G0WFZ7_NAUDC|nr:hypothetical protein NDAI_0I01390 [Naumovozyma dairenensis CBS 421]CCD26708.1 hypothetical protein NDAI_0I01390 [Naumovozyma dairenensis CBS 421]
MLLITKNLLACILVSCLGSIQFGFHLGILNVPSEILSCSEFKIPNELLPYEDTWLGSHNFKQCIPMDDEQLGILNAIFCLGGLFGSYFVGDFADRYGRRCASLYNCFLGILASLLLFSSGGFQSLLWGRFLMGVSCGVMIVISPLYSKEVTPAAWKGILDVLNQVSVKAGILFTQIIGLTFDDSYRWRWIFFTGAMLSLLNMFMWLRVDDSPRWLFSKGFRKDTERVLFELLGGTYDEAKKIVDEWTREAELQANMNNIDNNGGSNSNSSLISGPSSMWQYLRNDIYKNPRRIIAILLVGQQLCGINSLIFYGIRVINQVDPKHSIQINILLSLTTLLITFLTSIMIAILNRKPLLIISTIVIIISSLFMSVGINENKPLLLTINIFLYSIGYAIGLGPLPFVIMQEVSTPVDQKMGTKYGTAWNWIGSMIVGYIFPVLYDILVGHVYTIFAIVSILLACHIYQGVPETKNKKSFLEMWSGY